MNDTEYLARVQVSDPASDRGGRAVIVEDRLWSYPRFNSPAMAVSVSHDAIKSTFPSRGVLPSIFLDKRN